MGYSTEYLLKTIQCKSAHEMLDHLQHIKPCGKYPSVSVITEDIANIIEKDIALFHDTLNTPCEVRYSVRFMKVIRDKLEIFFGDKFLEYRIYYYVQKPLVQRVETIKIS